MKLMRLCVPVAASLVIFLGCKSQPKDPIPTQAPAPISADKPEQVLDHLRYMAVRKDLKHAAVISLAGFDTNALYGNVKWFISHPGDMGVPFSAEEIQAFNLGDLEKAGMIAPGVSRKELKEAAKDLKPGQKLPAPYTDMNAAKLDTLPDSGDKTRKADYELVQTKLADIANAGLYRTIKVVPESLWKHITIHSVTPNKQNPKDTDVFLKAGENVIAQVAVGPRKDGSLGIVYVYYKVSLPGLKKLEQAMNAGAASK